jgi:hypothetical protein
MDEHESLSHATWTCKCHVVFIDPAIGASESAASAALFVSECRNKNRACVFRVFWAGAGGDEARGRP